MKTTLLALVLLMLGCVDGAAILGTCQTAKDGEYRVRLTRLSGDCPEVSEPYTLINTVPTADCKVISREERSVSCSVSVTVVCGSASTPMQLGRMSFAINTNQDGTFRDGILAVSGLCTGTFAMDYE